MSYRKSRLSFTGLLVVASLLLPLRALAILGDCGQPVTNGANPVATDARRVLTTGVGATTCSDTFDACICDVNNSGATNSTDALLTLQKGVGQDVVLNCGICPPTSTTTSTSTTTTTTIPGGGTSNCTNNGNCSDDDCVCSDCDRDLFCGDPASCNNDGACQSFQEGCVCADCMTHPECLDN